MEHTLTAENPWPLIDFIAFADSASIPPSTARCFSTARGRWCAGGRPRAASRQALEICVDAVRQNVDALGRCRLGRVEGFSGVRWR